MLRMLAPSHANPDGHVHADRCQFQIPDAFPLGYTQAFQAASAASDLLADI